eukprot:12901690-Prorocentrum_lima.AAC.1
MGSTAATPLRTPIQPSAIPSERLAAAVWASKGNHVHGKPVDREPRELPKLLRLHRCPRSAKGQTHGTSA